MGWEQKKKKNCHYYININKHTHTWYIIPVYLVMPCTGIHYVLYTINSIINSLIVHLLVQYYSIITACAAVWFEAHRKFSLCSVVSGSRLKAQIHIRSFGICAEGGTNLDKNDARSVSSFKLQVDQTNKPALPGIVRLPSSVRRLQIDWGPVAYIYWR